MTIGRSQGAETDVVPELRPLSLGHRRSQIPRFHQRHRGDRGRSLPPASRRRHTEQAKRLWHTSNLFQIPGQERLAQRLVDNTFADTVFFGNSGAEACELAIKIARKYQSETGHPERYRIIACEGSFHGRTLATLAAAGNEAYLKGFGPAMDGFDHVAFGNLNEMRAAIGKETAAIFVEPIQGEGGVRAAPSGYLKGLRDIADEFGLLLVYDEVQSGMGRTGKLFAHEWEGVPPDVMAIAKALGGGFPIRACR